MLSSPLVRLITRRLAFGVVILAATSVMVFAGTDLLAGDTVTAALGPQAPPSQVKAVRDDLHLDRGPVSRYFAWAGDVVSGDLGTSLISKRSVASQIGAPFKRTAILAIVTMVVLFPLCFVLGTAAAVRRYGPFDSAISALTITLISVPEFVTGALLVALFAAALPIFPAVSLVSSGDSFGTVAQALVLPVVTLVAASIAYTTRMVRGSMIEALESDFVQMARLKGVPEGRVVVRHAMRNALVPAIQAMALAAGLLLSGVVVVEFVFAYPGIGQALVHAVAGRDAPTVQAIALIMAAFYVLVNLIADIATILLTPKLRTGP